MNDRPAVGIGHWAFTQNPDGPAWGFRKGRVRARVVQRQQGHSCVESGGQTRTCHVSAAHTGGCCFLLRGYPTSAVYRSMVRSTASHTVCVQQGAARPATTWAACLGSQASTYLGRLHLVRRVGMRTMGWVVMVRGIRYVHTIAHPAGRNSLKELPGWDPARGQTARPGCPSGDSGWGQATAMQWHPWRW